jgi:hypothetical protein
MIRHFGRSSRIHGRLDPRAYAMISGLVTILLVSGQVMAIIGLAAFNPFLPGNVFFPLQASCEEMGAWVFTPGVGRTRYYLNLTEERVDDLEARIGTRHELAALTALDTALDRASKELENSTGGQISGLWVRLLALVQRSENTLSRLTEIPSAYAMVVMAFQTRLHTLRELGMSRSRWGREEGLMAEVRNLVKAEIAAGVVATGGTDLPGGLIPFPPGSLGAVHVFYTLIGRHTALECSTCHTKGQYRGVSSSCEGCHAEVKPNDHYIGDCAACHNPNGWQEVVFDHLVVGATDCQGCHATDTPANHYNGQCSNCHALLTWQGAVFNHRDYTDCLTCHGGDAPANHYSGQCSKCHNTAGWPGATFSHNGYTDCQRCHAGDAPNNHFSGQCSQCHSTSNWRGASFNHAGFTDCLGCHGGDAPRNHFSGQCSQCHNQTNWRDARFNHSGQSDCISCHLDDRPGEHDSGQCSECHHTDKWDD